jgi:hypothetical protein
VSKESPQGLRLMPYFEEYWATYLDVMQDFVSISIEAAELIVSPAYDVGLTREELVTANFDKLSKLAQS